MQKKGGELKQCLGIVGFSLDINNSRNQAPKQDEEGQAPKQDEENQKSLKVKNKNMMRLLFQLQTETHKSNRQATTGRTPPPWIPESLTDPSRRGTGKRRAGQHRSSESADGRGVWCCDVGGKRCGDRGGRRSACRFLSLPLFLRGRAGPSPVLSERAGRGCAGLLHRIGRGAGRRGRMAAW